jgi:hypothetical protein
VPVPRQLWATLGKQSYRQSLGTTDRILANLIATPILASWQSEFSHLLGTQVPESGHAAEVALRRVYRPLIAQYNRTAALALAEGNVSGIAQRAQDRITQRVLENSSGKLDLNRLADLLIADEGLNYTKGSREYIEFVDTLASLTIDAAENHAQVIAGNFSATPKTPLGKQAYERASLTAVNGETIAELFEL